MLFFKIKDHLALSIKSQRVSTAERIIVVARVDVPVLGVVEPVLRDDRVLRLVGVGVTAVAVVPTVLAVLLVPLVSADDLRIPRETVLLLARITGIGVPLVIRVVLETVGLVDLLV